MIDTPLCNHPALFLIVIEDLLIREDLRQAIVESVPFAEVRIADDAAAADAIAQNAGSGLTAFVSAEPALFAASPLAQTLQSVGANVILTEAWDASDPVPRGWDFLPAPFTSQDIHAILNRAPTDVAERRTQRLPQ